MRRARHATVAALLLLGSCSRATPERAPEPAPLPIPGATSAHGTSDTTAAGPAAPGANPPSLSFTTLAPGLRLDKAARVVEFDGTVPIDCHDPRTPDVYLELVVTGPDSREHESLVLTAVPASLLHAALLAAGFEPGRPGSVRVTEDVGTVRTPARGAAIRVQLITRASDGTEHTTDAARWVVGVDSGIVLAEADGWDGFVFAGSTIVERAGRTHYAADATGTIIGLTTFGTETITPSLPLSPESGIDEPAWIARRELVPPRGTPVVVRLSPAG